MLRKKYHSIESDGSDKREGGIVRFDNIKYCYQSNNGDFGHFQLGPLSLDIYQGELLVLLGPSGSGKTTLLRLIAGLETPNLGEIYIDGRLVFSKFKNIVPEKRHVGMMFQDHALFPHLNVKNNILFGIRSWSKKNKEYRLQELKELLGLEECLIRFPHELSGGQQQRVALARTLAPKPKVILLDEPLCSIDADLRSSLAQELRDVLKATFTTAVWVTHDQTEALDLADRILVVNNGQIEQIADPWHLYNEPRTRFVADFVGHAAFLKGAVKGEFVDTEIGSVSCPPCLKNSGQLELMVRPDDVQASVHDQGIGVVTKRQFFGSMQLYSIILPSGQILLVTQPAQTDWKIGTKVRVDLKMKSVVAFPV